MTRQRIIAGNWKMNGTPEQTESIIRPLLARNPKSAATVVICPPFISMPAASKLLSGSGIALGGQDCSDREDGAFTGDISASMLLTIGASHVILGHSERRQYHQETDALINAKLRRALHAGLTPIVCVGETLAQRETDQTESVVRAQVAGVLSGLSPEQLTRLVIAYEPVWAIGTGKTATPEQAEEVHRFIRAVVAGLYDQQGAERLSILYGGSVKGSNAVQLLSQPNVDGALVGGASLIGEEFAAIVDAA